MLALLVAALPCLARAAPSVMSCMSDDNKPVDWWVAFKFPSGTNYGYADSNKATVVRSPYEMSDLSKGALTNTVVQVYNANASGQDSGFAFYNDQTPDGKQSSSRGHTKGVVGLFPDGGFWLVHSVPKYPTYMADGFQGWGEASQTYGQSFLCMTMALEEFETVGQAFQLNFPQYYDWNMPLWVPEALFTAVTKSTHTTDPVSSKNFIQTLQSVKFQVFAKTSKWNNFLYSNLVAPTIGAGIYVESWQNGDIDNRIPTACTNATNPYDVIDVRNVSCVGTEWKETQDHSKWCVTLTSAVPVVCIGDINQQYSQNTRGGGTVCQQNSQLWTSVRNMVVGADSCPDQLKSKHAELHVN